MSELLSIALFLASVVLYARKAGRNTWWFAATLTVLGLFVVLNITLYASDYFTGDGINDAVLYTLTNSLTGAGIGKLYTAGVGVAVALVAVFGALGWGAAPPSASILITSVTAWRRYCWRWPPLMPARPSIRSASW